MLDAPAPLPAQAELIIEALSPRVTRARLARMHAVVARRSRSLVPVLEDIADPHNVAAILRSADAFGCQEVHLVEPRRPFAFSHRISRGADRWLELTRHDTMRACLDTLGARGYSVYVAAMDGELTPEDLAKVPRAAIVFGNEHKGASAVARQAAAGTCAVPMAGFVESLNVSVASAVTLYVASRSRSGDLDEQARAEVLARFLLASVHDAERRVREHLDSTCGG
jgi:tRNA (guanosine-2'-O-)-methyltransferase